MGPSIFFSTQSIDYYCIQRKGNTSESAEPDEIPLKTAEAIDAIFSLLPYKHTDHSEKDALDRPRDDEACRKAFALLRRSETHSEFIRTALGLVTRKATWNAHDMKFPAAAFENVNFIRTLAALLPRRDGECIARSCK
ncbi:MAG TPA: hypothetical protein VM260_03725 [Pirellula sp.]|nr:hypothetical protein [Pirellula sp.]